MPQRVPAPGPRASVLAWVMQRRAVLIGFLGVVVVAALIAAVVLSGDGPHRAAGDRGDSADGSWSEVTLRVEGMT